MIFCVAVLQSLRIQYFSRNDDPKKLHEESDQVYEITVLKGNCTKYNVHFDGSDKMQNAGPNPGLCVTNKFVKSFKMMSL